MKSAVDCCQSQNCCGLVVSWHRRHSCGYIVNKHTQPKNWSL